LSIGLIMNFLSLKDMLRISLQGNPIFGVSLQKHHQETLTHTHVDCLTVYGNSDNFEAKAFTFTGIYIGHMEVHYDI